MTAEATSLSGLEVQLACRHADIPARADFETWAAAALAGARGATGLVIRIVNEAESRELNRRYRGRDAPTNVLSFPFEPPPGVDTGHLGDLVVCAPVVAREAAEQGKPVHHHWAHMVVHGILHLRGYDHQDDEQAQTMETLETTLLAQLGIDDPYRNADEAVKGKT